MTDAVAFNLGSLADAGVSYFDVTVCAPKVAGHPCLTKRNRVCRIHALHTLCSYDVEEQIDDSVHAHNLGYILQKNIYLNVWAQCRSTKTDLKLASVEKIGETECSVDIEINVGTDVDAGEQSTTFDFVG